MLTQDRIKELFSYCPNTGVFTRIKGVSGSGSRAGAIANHKANNGYISIRVDGKAYSGHRLVWLYMFGKFPDNQIDHINHIRDDNRIDNLRDVTHQENSRNRTASKYDSLGFAGVTWVKSKNRWQAEIKVMNKSVCRSK